MTFILKTIWTPPTVQLSLIMFLLAFPFPPRFSSRLVWPGLLKLEQARNDDKLFTCSMFIKVRLCLHTDHRQNGLMMRPRGANENRDEQSRATVFQLLLLWRERRKVDELYSFPVPTSSLRTSSSQGIDKI